LKPDGTNERWFETVERVVNGTYTMMHAAASKNPKAVWIEDKATKSAKKMFDKIFHMKFVPPGRGLYAMGTKITENLKLYASLNNCFASNVEFITDRGVVTFADFSPGDKVNVLSEDGEYRPARVNSFGKQELFEVTLRPKGLRSNLRQRFRATKNHTWILSNGQRTTDLKVGDVVTAESYDHYAENLDGFAHGLIFGDGTRNTYYPKRHFIKICMANREELALKLALVEGYVSTTRGSDGYPVVTIVREGENWKELPFPGSSPDYIASFVKGWIEADGWKKPSGSYCLDMSNLKAAKWIIKHAPMAGFVATGHSVETRDTNYGPRTEPLQRISLRPGHVDFVVESIDPTGQIEEVYCVTEPETSSFVLVGGIRTGNCAFVSTKVLHEEKACRTRPFEFLMLMSMMGVGVGFDVRGKGAFPISKPKEEEENSTIVHVIEDSREGWVDSTVLLLATYFYSDHASIRFDYSSIRPKGTPLKTFGGFAPGPDPLEKLHTKLRTVLDAKVGQDIGTVLITDIMNLIGMCVVAGGVRRTAEIALGEKDDEEFIHLKDFGKGRDEWMWTSNNSVHVKRIASESEAIRYFLPLTMRTAANGEPGYFWLENMQNYARMLPKDPFHRTEPWAVGTNPCAGMPPCAGSILYIHLFVHSLTHFHHK
jgi:hypothetical protein